MFSDLSGEYTVNGFNIENDVMRYDKKNIVLGKKFIDAVIVDELKLNKNIYLQNVDILHWINKAILKNQKQFIPLKSVFSNFTVFSNILR